MSHCFLEVLADRSANHVRHPGIRQSKPRNPPFLVAFFLFDFVWCLVLFRGPFTAMQKQGTSAGKIQNIDSQRRKQRSESRSGNVSTSDEHGNNSHAHEKEYTPARKESGERLMARARWAPAGGAKLLVFHKVSDIGV